MSWGIGGGFCVDDKREEKRKAMAVEPKEKKKGGTGGR